MTTPVSRRTLLQNSIAVSTGLAIGTANEMTPVAAAESSGNRPFTTCLNTSTIARCQHATKTGDRVPLTAEIDIASKAGYEGIEPWIREIDQHVNNGGALDDLRKRISDAGLTVDSAIGFASWIVDDDDKRTEGVESLKRDMEKVAKIGGTRIAAPPVGATQQTDLNLFEAAERYRVILQAGQQIGVVPQLELWGFSKSLSRLGELIFVAVESGHADACMLPDVYHIYKGGSDFTGLQLIDGGSIHVLHINDYPDIPNDKIKDADRVFPGDGVAPVPEILRRMRSAGFAGSLSLELFNDEYYQRDAFDVAKEGLDKIHEVVAKMLE